MINDMIRWVEDGELTLRQIQSKPMEHHRISVGTSSIGTSIVLDLEKIHNQEDSSYPKLYKQWCQQKSASGVFGKIIQSGLSGLTNPMWNIICRRTVVRFRKGMPPVSSLSFSRGPNPYVSIPSNINWRIDQDNIKAEYYKKEDVRNWWRRWPIVLDLGENWWKLLSLLMTTHLAIC